MRILKFLLLLYRKLRVTPSPCRYYPSCSFFAEQALDRHGLIKGLWLTLGRILRCNGYFKGGFDPVPD